MYLCLFSGQRQDDWADLLPVAEFVLNSRTNTSTKRSPFKLIYGYKPDFTIPISCKSTDLPALDDRLDSLRMACKDAEAALCRAKDKMKQLPSKPLPNYKVGDMVWLQAKDIQIKQASRKLGPRQLGPLEVLETKFDLTYHLKLPPALKVHDVFHINWLSPWGGNKINGQRPPKPGPIEIEGEEEYKVKEVLDSILRGCQGLFYLVKWKGYGTEHNLWEPKRNLGNAGN